MHNKAAALKPIWLLGEETCGRTFADDSFYQMERLKFMAPYRSLQKHPTTAAFANRAMVRLKRDDLEGAEEDSSAALELDPSHIKSWQRRATARQKLGKLLDAAQDFEEAFRSEYSIELHPL